MLVQSQQAVGSGASRQQRIGEGRQQGLRDHRQVDGERVAVDDPQHREQALVVPPGVIVAQEEVDRDGRLVERRT